MQINMSLKFGLTLKSKPASQAILLILKDKNSARVL